MVALDAPEKIVEQGCCARHPGRHTKGLQIGARKTDAFQTLHLARVCACQTRQIVEVFFRGMREQVCMG